MDADGQLLGFAEIWHDPTREQCLVKALDHARCLAAVGRGFAVAAHRVKNIITGLIGSAALVNHALEREDIRAATRAWPIFARSIDILTNLVEQMLAFSKAPELCRTTGNLNAVASQVVDLCRETAAMSHVEIEIRLDPALPQSRFDRTATQDALLNLVENAIEACSSVGGGKVTVETAHNPLLDTATIEVADDGPGIPPPLRERIFEPFFSTKGKTGTGLGLPSCMKCVRAHGGRLTHRSDANRTVFRVELPLGQSTTSSPPAGLDEGDAMDADPYISSAAG
jgi:nitrogen-specific signal transduction histidine kinase